MIAKAKTTKIRNDGKGGGSLDESASKSHHKQERVAQGINSNIAEVQEVVRKQVGRSVMTWIDQQRDRL